MRVPESSKFRNKEPDYAPKEKLWSEGTNASSVGSDVELVNFPAITLNGGNGATTGGSASGQAFEIYTYSPGTAAGPITDEAAIEAKGGKATGGTGSTGGTGGYVEMRTNGTGDPAEVINNSGSIYVSGGTGDTGGSGNTVNIWAQHVTNSASLTVNGGDGTTTGGNGGNISLTSNNATMPTTNTGALSVAGGAPSGNSGTKTIDGTVIP